MRRKPKQWIQRLKTQCADHLHQYLMDVYGYEDYVKEKKFNWTLENLSERELFCYEMHCTVLRLNTDHISTERIRRLDNEFTSQLLTPYRSAENG